MLKRDTQQKLKMKTTQTTLLITYPVENISKPGKVWAVFHAGVTYNLTSLNKSLLKGPDLLNNLVGVLTCFRMGSYAVMGNIEQIFH